MMGTRAVRQRGVSPLPITPSSSALTLLNHQISPPHPPPRDKKKVIASYWERGNVF